MQVVDLTIFCTLYTKPIHIYSFRMIGIQSLRFFTFLPSELKCGKSCKAADVSSPSLEKRGGGEESRPNVLEAFTSLLSGNTKVIETL